MDYSRFQGQPFEIISRHACRYTGIFDRVEPETLTICLRDVYNHGTEDRPAPVRYPGSAANMGWIRFHTESIESMRLAENYVPPSQPEPPQDPAIASMSRQEPPPASAPQQQRSESAASRPAPQHTPRSNQSIDTAMDRVQASLSSLSVENQAGPSGQYHGQGGQGSRPRRQPQGPSGGGWVNTQRQRQPPEAPDAEFDFSKANEAFEKERALMKQQRKASVAAESAASENKNGDNDNDDDDDEEEQIVLKGDIHPMALKPQEPKSAAGAGVGTGGAYKKSSFFDDLTSSTSRVSIQQERGRNLDTFGEAGGAARGGTRGGYGSGGGRGRGGQGGGSGGYARGGGYGGGQAYGGRGNGRGRGGYGRGRGGYGQSQPTAEWA